MQLLVFDPGGATGWANYRQENDTWVITSGTEWESDHHIWLADKICAAKHFGVPDLTVITESFEFRQNPDSAMKRRGLELVSREYIGVMKYICELEDINLVQQMPAHALSFMTDTKLEKMGHLRTPLHECRHENDALRHLFFYLISNLKVPHWRDKLKQ